MSFHPVTCYPNKGALYLASAPQLAAQGLLKFGRTTDTLKSRSNGHTGQLSRERSTIFFALETNDCVSAEAQLKSLLKAQGLLDPAGDGKKEFCLGHDVERIKALMAQAIATAKVRTGVLLTPCETQMLKSSKPAWNCLMQFRIKWNKQTTHLGHLMLASLRQPHAHRALQSHGLCCTYASLQTPEFTLKELSDSALAWLESHGHRLEDLRDTEDGAYSEKFKIDTAS